MVKWVQLENPVHLARLARLVSKVCKDHLDFLEFLVNLADQVKLDNRDRKAHEVKLDHKDYQAILVKWDFLVSLVKRDHKGPKVNKETPDLLEQWVLLEKMV